ncbi:general secretion pathway protein D [Thioploca ingrica]|uniref:General secretion pathway protein D n=1 Tax=Thioploca ingrica TaxID=40754 RepID=A0A090AEV0_9GAMM|nr:general secretion pathway protein D [Thioploca ingrica]
MLSTSLPSTPPVTSPTLAQSLITELPRSQAKPLKQVNQAGQVPTTTTLTEQTLDTSNLDLSEGDEIQLDFEQTDLRQILEIIADSLKISLVIDPTIGDKVSLRTAPDKPLTKKDLWPLLKLLLNDAGITMEKRGGVYHLKKMPPTLPGDISLSPEKLTSSDSPEVMQITPLRFIAVEAAQAILTPLIQPKGRLITLATLNIIGIITTPQQLERVNKLLDIVDADPFLHRGMRLFRLANSKATEVQAELDKILKALYGTAPPTYQSVALERINAILVVAPPNSGFNEVASWVEILDESSEDSGEQVFIYKVKNLEASKIAATLSSVFKLEDQKAAEEKEKMKRNEKKPPISPEEEREKPLPITPTTTSTGTLPVSAELKVNIVADENTNSLLIRASPRDYRQLLETIYLLDHVPKEVMVNVVIAEVTLTEATKFGIDWYALFNERLVGGSDLSVPGGNFTTSRRGTASGNNLLPLPSFDGFTLGYLSGGLNAVLNLIASTGDTSILSRPSILVRNNEEASINVGSSEPTVGSLVTPSINLNNNSTSNTALNNPYQTDVQYKDTGITLKVTPRINEDGIINMKISQEVSQLGGLRTTQNLQSFVQRKLETSVVVRDNNAIVMGGLIETKKNQSSQGIPGLKDIPLVGSTLFSTTNQEDTRTELVLLIVPQIVNPEIDNRPLVQDFIRRMQATAALLNDQDIFVNELGFNKPNQPLAPPKNNISSSAETSHSSK